MRKLSIGIQSFEDLRNNDYVYVDKTKYIYDLVSRNKVYFLSRPRRFGKSLFLSTLDAYFSGKSDLFRGLYIEKFEDKKERKWVKYPVIHISFAVGDYSNAEELTDKIDGILNDYENIYNISEKKKILGDRLVDIMKAAKAQTGNNSVVLIDEYDKPLLDNIGSNKKLEEKNRKILKGFYMALKDGDDYLKFAFVTGVTKFSKVSLFSDVNQLKDISLNPLYSAICGITEDELKDNYMPEIEAMAKSNNITSAECIKELRQNYDGYNFSENSEGVYNPFSVLNALSDQKMSSYWYSTGTSAFLIEMLRQSDAPMESLSEGVNASEQALSDFTDDNPNPIPLFYQTGYLTISDYNKMFNVYTLKYPNKEVEYSFLKSLLPVVYRSRINDGGDFVMDIVTKLMNGDVDGFMRTIRSLFAGIPYAEGETPFQEREWRNQMYLLFKVMNQYVLSEVHSSEGRCDCVVETSEIVYIFEFKQDKTADEALKQIDEKGYAVKYEASGKQIVKIGANFSSKSKTLTEWKVE